jgi:hypothetical protein
MSIKGNFRKDKSKRMFSLVEIIKKEIVILQPINQKIPL